MGLNFREELLERLKDPKEASAYLKAAYFDQDALGWLIALRTLSEAKGGLTLLSKKTGIHRVHLYRMLGKDGNPSFKNMMTVLEALGVQVDFSVRPSRSAKAAASAVKKTRPRPVSAKQQTKVSATQRG